MLKKNLAFIVVALWTAASIVSCSTSDIAKGKSETAVFVDTLLNTVAQACAIYAPVAASLATAPDPRIGSLAAYGNSVCAANGSVAPNVGVDAGTAGWVGAITGALRVLAAVKPA